MIMGADAASSAAFASAIAFAISASRSSLYLRNALASALSSFLETSVAGSTSTISCLATDFAGARIGSSTTGAL